MTRRFENPDCPNKALNFVKRVYIDENNPSCVCHKIKIENNVGEDESGQFFIILLKRSAMKLQWGKYVVVTAYIIRWLWGGSFEQA